MADSEPTVESRDPPSGWEGGPNRPSAAHSSSSSSDILVAPGPPPPAQPSAFDSVLALSPVTAMSKPIPLAEVRDGHLLIVKFNSATAREALGKLKDRQPPRSIPTLNLSSAESLGVKAEGPEDDQDGPNARGTYSKQYTLLHPEMEWVHRGQGRYLPAAQSRPSPLIRSDSNPKASDYNLRKVVDDWRSKASDHPIPPRRRSLDDDTKFTTPRQRLSLRRQVSEAQTASSADHLSVRPARRARLPSSSEFERRSSRNLTQQNYNESDENDSMAGDKEPTYDKQYVDAHPAEKFYHTGNGWYKRGDRPKGRRIGKPRDMEGHSLVRRSDGSYAFDGAKTIHVTQLDNYPGVEFHHCGNGWYKPGPDATGHRSSLVVGNEDLPMGDDDEDEDEANEDDDAAVSKEYALAHPEVKWVHRGNGWYKRQSAVSIATTQASQSASPAYERDQSIYSKEYVLAHPEEEFHHRGNARYMRGPAPEHWAASRRKRSFAAVSPMDDGEDRLYSKSYVRAHPDEVFHHRGQGRYARGPRPSQTYSEDEDEEDEFEEEDPDGLVTTDYVNAHPEETFHHRGQGRWARGLPPPGASNKTAIRGPGGRERSDAATLLEEEDEYNKPPPLTALVMRAEGPDKWPGLNWYYRGGGKWGRLTKQDFEALQKHGSRRPKVKPRTSYFDGPEAQLEREAAAAENTSRYGGGHGSREDEQPVVKRRRMNKLGGFQGGEDGLMSSALQSQVPTPRPRMLEPEEDVLQEEDLPQLYRDDDWSPDPEDIDDYGQHRLANLYRPINPVDTFVRALTKHDPIVRSLDNLKRLAENTQLVLNQLQDEYLFLDKVTAPHNRIPRKPAKGGRLPVEEQIFEDRKEAELYDYAFDARRIGFQDPYSQRIQRDVDGRELRHRRQRGTAQAHSGTLPGWNFGDDEPLGPRRAVKPVNRFDGIIDQPRRRRTHLNSKAPSMTPDDPTTTPLGGPMPNGYAPATRGRWRGHVPKRIRELRGDSVGVASAREESPGNGAAGGAAGHKKGRPPGSKNLHKRRDAGIKKGPRKSRGFGGGDEREVSVGSEMEVDDEGEMEE